MTRPSIFRCFLFLYRSLNFPAKKKNKLPASHEEAPLLRHSKSVVVVVVVVLMLLLLLLLPLLLLLACLHVGGDVDPSHLLARVCVCVCVCVFWLRFFFALIRLPEAINGRATSFRRVLLPVRRRQKHGTHR